MDSIIDVDTELIQQIIGEYVSVENLITECKISSSNGFIQDYSSNIRNKVNVNNS